MNISKQTFTVFDVETTGLSAVNGDRICEIAAMKVRGRKVIDRFQSMVNPEMPVSPQAFAVNGISPEMLHDAPRFVDIAPSFHSFIQQTVLVAQNSNFDLSFLNTEFAHAALPSWGGFVLDTISLARRAVPTLPKYNLDALAKHFNATFSMRHRAMGDVEVTVEVFLQSLTLLRKSGVVKSLEDVLQVGAPYRRGTKPLLKE